MYLKTDNKIIDMQTGTYIELHTGTYVEFKQEVEKSYTGYGIFLVIEDVINRHILIKNFDERKDAVEYFNKIALELGHSLGNVVYVDD